MRALHLALWKPRYKKPKLTRARELALMRQAFADEKDNELTRAGETVGTPRPPVPQPRSKGTR